MKRLLRREQALAERRRLLLVRAGAQRAQLVAALDGLQGSLGGAERALGVARWLRRHAIWIGAAGAALLLWRRPRRLLPLVLRAWSVWRGVRLFIP